ncbi:hypothetical protein TruAng_003393 [Truncatella angustata]|nr:hypothetical protein TruAng_003393 [Truncatella angustata]
MSRLLPSFTRRIARPSIHSISRRAYATNPFGRGPSPPRLPSEEQAEFERLQRSANTQEPLDPVERSSPSSTPPQSQSSSSSSATQINPTPPNLHSDVARESMSNPATLGEVSNLPLRKGAPPEFEGEVNPKTGEVGGPKNEPLRWGHSGDWSYNGRVTDF